MAELHGLWIAAMFAADPDLQFPPNVASLGHCSFHQLSHTRLVEGGEGRDYGRKRTFTVVQNTQGRSLLTRKM